MCIFFTASTYRQHAYVQPGFGQPTCHPIIIIIINSFPLWAPGRGCRGWQWQRVSSLVAPAAGLLCPHGERTDPVSSASPVERALILCCVVDTHSTSLHPCSFPEPHSHPQAIYSSLSWQIWWTRQQAHGEREISPKEHFCAADEADGKGGGSGASITSFKLPVSQRSSHLPSPSILAPHSLPWRKPRPREEENCLRMESEDSKHLPAISPPPGQWSLLETLLSGASQQWLLNSGVSRGGGPHRPSPPSWTRGTLLCGFKDLHFILWTKQMLSYLDRFFSLFLERKRKKKKVKSLSRVWLFANPWTVAHQAPPSMRISRQEYWSGLPLVSIFLPIVFSRKSRHLLSGFSKFF